MFAAMRRLFVDLDSGKITIAAGTTQPETSISEKRSPNAELQVQFLRQVTPQELSVGASGIFEVKEKGKYDSDALTAALSWVKTGTGVNTIYKFTLDLMNTALDALLGINPQVAVTANAATDTLTSAAHGLVLGNKIQFTTSNTLPAGLSLNTDYYVISAGLTANDFRVSLTSGGSVVDITSTGTGTHKWTRIDNDIVSVTLMAALQWIADGRTNETQTIDFVLVNDVVRDTDTGIPPAAAYSILNVAAGKTAISNGAESVAKVFDTAFASGANVAVIATVAMPSGGDNIFATIDESTVSNTGFTARLSAAAPNGNYKLNWMAVAI